jgi:hypothetical protein
MIPYTKVASSNIIFNALSLQLSIFIFVANEDHIIPSFRRIHFYGPLVSPESCVGSVSGPSVAINPARGYSGVNLIGINRTRLFPSGEFAYV